MDIETFRAYCLSKPGTFECFPFDDTTLVFKVVRKMFALCPLDDPFKVNLKCDPDRALELREEHPEIQPGWHMNKSYWNTVDFEGGLSDRLLRELIDHSYEEVVRTLKKSERAELQPL
jgi:predicted DNA-binding protein (MmcQ/YjbR family)